MRKYIAPFFVFVIYSFASCGQQTFDEKMQSLYKNTVPLINASDLMDRMDQVILLDTRAPEEFAVSHIEGSRCVDYDGFKMKDVKDIPKDAEVVVYCSVGYRSERIGEKLREAGYENVKNLYGGIFDWKNQGMTLKGRL